MKFQRKTLIVEAAQILEGQPLPDKVHLCAGGELAVRVTDYSHDNPNYGDYIVYTPVDPIEEGELVYPSVWPEQKFLEMFEPLKESK